MTMPSALYLAAAACVTVAGDRIAARDLAPAVAAFRAIAPDTELGYAPAPGARRIFRAAELVRLIRRSAGAGDAGTSVEPGGICVERDMGRVTPEALRTALAAAAGDPQVTIELVQWSRYPVPSGAIEFPRSGIAASRGNVALWRGYVKYGTNRRFAIWARVRLSVNASRLVARENLPAGIVIRPDQLRAEIVERFPFGPRPAGSLDEAEGRVPRRSIPAGAVVWPGNLETPLEVHAGDAVSLEVSSGQAQLTVEGRAVASGHRGDIIPVRNLANGKTLRARVKGPGKAAIDVRPAWPAQGLAPAQGEK